MFIPKEQIPGHENLKQGTIVRMSGPVNLAKGLEFIVTRLGVATIDELSIVKAPSPFYYNGGN